MAIAPCAPTTTPVHGVVVFEPAVFIVLYPAFATIAAPALQQNFDLATLLLGNGCGSRVSDARLRERLLNLLTAHITAILNGANGQPPSGGVGRVASATEGSVTATLDMGPVTNSEAFFIQTQWGAMYWAATARFRTAFYVAPPPRCYGVGFGDQGFGPVGTGYPGNNGGTS